MIASEKKARREVDKEMVQIRKEELVLKEHALEAKREAERNRHEEMLHLLQLLIKTQKK